MSKKRVNTVMKKVKAEGGVKKDKRVKQVKRTLAEEVIDGIVQHVCLFKTVASHYVQKNSNYQYLPIILDIATMHCLYIHQMECRKKLYTCRLFRTRTTGRHAN